MPDSRRVALVTGGGSGIGAATAARLAQDGYDVVLAGRRRERLEAAAASIGPQASVAVLDVTDEVSVATAVSGLSRCDVLVNNAGGALGADRVEGGDVDEWRAMFDTNVLGTLRVTKAVLPLLRRSPGATVVTITSIAAFLVYEGGAGYTAAKHAEQALSDTLRLELNGERIRVVDVAPGMVQTESFSLARFHGDAVKAEAVYDGVDHPLTAQDVAECVAFCVRLPQHVNIDRLVVKPVAQAAPHKLHRGPIDWGDAGSDA